MKPETYRNYYLSSKWKQISKAFMRNHGYFCDLCKAINRLEVHHVNYDHQPGTERKEDMMVVCNRCHNDLHKDLECFSSKRNEDLKIIG